MPYMRVAKRKRSYGKRYTRKGPASRQYRIGGAGPQRAALRVGPRSAAAATSTGQIKRTMTQMTSGNIGQITILTDAAGACQWQLGTQRNQCIQLGFALQETNVYIGTAIVATIPNPAYLFQTATFQRYRLDRIELSMYVGMNSVMDETPGTNPLIVTELANPMVMYVIDSDDSAPVTQDMIMTYGNMNLLQPTVGKPLQCSFRPAALNNLANTTGVGVNAGTTFSPIISTDYADVNHFGFKAVATDFSVFPGGGAYQCAVNFVVKYHMTFFDPK